MAQPAEGPRLDAEGKGPEEVDSVVVLFAGDSGDGMQLTGSELTRSVARSGNDVATFNDFPAEIRAPAGKTYGVSGFQLHFSSSEVFTPGDEADVLVTMNPAALSTNLAGLRDGGMLIVDSGSFRAKNLEAAGYSANPLEDGSLTGFRVVQVDMSRAVTAGLKGSGLSTRDVLRTRNFFALGLVFWLFGRDTEPQVRAIRRKFATRPAIADANVQSFQSGYAYGDTTECFSSTYRVPAAGMPAGTYRNVSGNDACAIGLVAASLLAGRRLLYASYPITPASDILHALAGYSRYPVTIFQAEDEIAAASAAIGASFGGAIGVTGTSGPGLALKQEAIGLAVMAELPLVIIDVQRGGPSTGLPTKPEQGDLLQAMYGRNSESPVAILAPATPPECFEMAIEAVRIAIGHMCPVILLSDGTLGSGVAPWVLPSPQDLAEIQPGFDLEGGAFAPYLRDDQTLARPWAVPGMPNREHRIGGLEKENVTGDVSYDPENHALMNHLRRAKIDRIAGRIAPAEVFGDSSGDLLLVGFGGTFGALRQATIALRREGLSVSHLHLRYLNPFQANVGRILGSFERILVPELNSGDLCSLLRARFLVRAASFPKVDGTPLKVREVSAAARAALSSPALMEISS